MKRRDFHRLCGGLVATASAQALSGSPAMAAGESAEAPTSEASTTAWPESTLMRDAVTPLTVADLDVGDCWIFHYPYVSTPSFLIRLGEPVESTVAGIGQHKDIVAFSAICSHKLTAPAKHISHINFRRDEVDYYNESGSHTQRNLISCCSERSIYDPARGAAVLSGPAPSALPAIRLASRDDGAIVASGSIGTDRYNDYLTQFGFRLALEMELSDVRALAGEQTPATPANTYSQQQIRC